MNAKFVEYPSSVPYSAVEAEILAYWNEHGIFARALKKNRLTGYTRFMKVLLLLTANLVFTMFSAVP